MRWTQHPHQPGALIAHGTRTSYTLARHHDGHRWIITETPHPGRLPLLDIPLDGRVFAELAAAKSWAERLDNRAGPDAQMGHA
jgi:hypothetical protein